MIQKSKQTHMNQFPSIATPPRSFDLPQHNSREGNLKHHIGSICRMLDMQASGYNELRTLGEVTRGGSQAGCVNLRAVHDRSCDSLGGWEILGEVPNEEGVTFVTWARRRRRKKSETCIFPPSTQIRWQTHHSAPWIFFPILIQRF